MKVGSVRVSDLADQNHSNTLDCPANVYVDVPVTIHSSPSIRTIVRRNIITPGDSRICSRIQIQGKILVKIRVMVSTTGLNGIYRASAAPCCIYD